MAFCGGDDIYGRIWDSSKSEDVGGAGGDGTNESVDGGGLEMVDGEGGMVVLLVLCTMIFVPETEKKCLC